MYVIISPLLACLLLIVSFNTNHNDKHTNLMHIFSHTYWLPNCDTYSTLHTSQSFVRTWRLLLPLSLPTTFTMTLESVSRQDTCPARHQLAPTAAVVLAVPMQWWRWRLCRWRWRVPCCAGPDMRVAGPVSSRSAVSRPCRAARRRTTREPPESYDASTQGHAIHILHS